MRESTAKQTEQVSSCEKLLTERRKDMKADDLEPVRIL